MYNIDKQAPKTAISLRVMTKKRLAAVKYSVLKVRKRHGIFDSNALLFISESACHQLPVRI
jgi:hypothetical protein